MSDTHWHGPDLGVGVTLVQERTACVPVIYLGRIGVRKCLILIDHVAGWVDLFEWLGQYELAATVRRLGELAEAEAVFSRPQPRVPAAHVRDPQAVTS